MKKFIFILCLLLIFTACENDEGTAPLAAEPTAQDSIKVYQGNFITTGNEAVLKGDRFIYQVVMDTTALSLRDSLKIEPDASALRPVVVKGKVKANYTGNGYSQLIEIMEILEIPEKEESTQ